MNFLGVLVQKQKLNGRLQGVHHQSTDDPPQAPYAIPAFTPRGILQVDRKDMHSFSKATRR
jgi:hypothetical protein